MAVPSHNGVIITNSKIPLVSNRHPSWECAESENVVSDIPYSLGFNFYFDAVVRTAYAGQKCTTLTKMQSFFYPFRFRCYEFSCPYAKGRREEFLCFSFMVPPGRLPRTRERPAYCGNFPWGPHAPLSLTQPPTTDQGA